MKDTRNNYIVKIKFKKKRSILDSYPNIVIMGSNLGSILGLIVGKNKDPINRTFTGSYGGFDVI